jgi:hypothetical protein
MKWNLIDDRAARSWHPARELTALPSVEPGENQADDPGRQRGS